MLQNGKPVQSLWLGGERFDKYSQDDEDALAKYKKLKSLIGSTVYVSSSDNIQSLSTHYSTKIYDIEPVTSDYVEVTRVIYDGYSGVDLIGRPKVRVQYESGTSETYYDEYEECIIGHRTI